MTRDLNGLLTRFLSTDERALLASAGHDHAALSQLAQLAQRVADRINSMTPRMTLPAGAASASAGASSSSSSSSNAASPVATAPPSASAQCASAGEPSVLSVRLGAFHAYNQAFGRKSDLGITVKATFSAPAPGVGLCVTLITPHGQVGSPSYTTSCVCGGECGGACVCE